MYDIHSSPQEKNLYLTFNALWIWALATIVIVAIYSISFLDGNIFSLQGKAKALSIFASCVLLGGASLSIGCLLGFLFGIPRTLQHDVLPQGSEQSTSTSNTAPDPGSPEYTQRVNTNLEQISDWLTKILVGVGLIQLGSLGSAMTAIADHLKDTFDGQSMVPLAVIVNFLILGFFSGYLLTRLFLASAFSVADRSVALLLRQERVGQVLQSAGIRDKAITQFAGALQQVTSETPKEVTKRLFEKIIYNSLYEPPPEGFTQAIKYGARYNREYKDYPSARIWFYLAAANGQQYSFESETQKRQEVLASARTAALEATQEALRLEPEIKYLLQLIWDPSHPGKSEDDNDLEVFYDDPDFKRLLGNETPSTQKV
jgi:hypothetical protein